MGQHRKPSAIMFATWERYQHKSQENLLQQHRAKTHKKSQPISSINSQRIWCSSRALASPFPNSNFSSRSLNGRHDRFKDFFRHVIAFLKANTKFYNLTKFRFKKRYCLLDMCAQSSPIKFEWQSILFHFIAHCSWLTNAINKCDNF